jgi:HD superfamily phosphodiesterase
MEIWINRAESTWLDVLYAHAEQLFRNGSLPSHDHTHHLRVWNLSKTLLREIASLNTETSYQLVEGVLIAAFFHDLGMAYSTCEDHGKMGSDLCLKWFRDTHRVEPERFEEILRAIELHDRKEVQLYRSFNRETPPEILGILSVADDLEAMGIIGIYRYTEIYLERGVPLETLGTRILENAKNRFDNLIGGCQLCGHVVEVCREQHAELHRFFEQYNLQLQVSPEPDKVFSGPLGVINYIRITGLDKTLIHPPPGEAGAFFRKLKNELDQARL